MGAVSEETSYRGVVEIKYDRGNGHGGETLVARVKFCFATKPNQMEIDKAMDRAVHDYLIEGCDLMVPKTLLVSFVLERIYVIKHFPDDTGTKGE